MEYKLISILSLGKYEWNGVVSLSVTEYKTFKLYSENPKRLVIILENLLIKSNSLKLLYLEMLSVLSKLCGSPNPSKSDNDILIELLSEEQFCICSIISLEILTILILLELCICIFWIALII